MQNLQNPQNLRLAVITAYYKEPLKVLKRCHDSVLKQSYEATHYMVADGYPRDELDSWNIRHLKLPQPSAADYGATPTCLGALAAFSADFDGVLFLDADNWFEPEHIAMLVTLQKQFQVPVVTATRILRKEDESALGISTEDGPNFTDTNCYLLMRETLWSLPAWVVRDNHNTPPDRLFWNEIVKKGYKRVHNSSPTVNYVTTWAVHYLQYREVPPKSAKLVVYIDERCYIVPFYGFIPVPFKESTQFGRKITEPSYFDDPKMQILQEKFNQFCKNFVTKPPTDKSKPPLQSSIPPIIHFIWLGSPIPEKVAVNIKSWKDLHPGWTIKIWMDKEAEQFPWSSAHSQQAFQSALNYAEKADIFRYEILYQFGGIYSDTDVYCLKPFHDLIASDLTFFSGLELNWIWGEVGSAAYISCGVIGVTMQSSITKFCIENYKTHGEDPHNNQVLRTGPGLLSRACHAALTTDQENILILPCSYLYPLAYERRDLNAEEIKKPFIAIESMAIHLWEKSWAK